MLSVLIDCEPLGQERLRLQLAHAWTKLTLNATLLLVVELRVGQRLCCLTVLWAFSSQGGALDWQIVCTMILQSVLELLIVHLISESLKLWLKMIFV